MEKSIEHIWKEGFLKGDTLRTPKVNNLYQQKSKNLIDRMMKMMRINILGIWVFAIAFFTYALSTGMPLALSLFLFLLFAAVAIYSGVQLKKIKRLDRNVSSYQYLRQFDHWLKEGISRNIQLARYFYPLCLLAAGLMLWFSEGRESIMEKLLEKYPDMLMISGIPFYFILGMVLIAGLMAVFAGKIYRWDINLVYGRVFKKLEQLIADLEELRS